MNSQWFDTGIIFFFFISYSFWISPIYVVNKKGGMTISDGKNDENISSRLVLDGKCVLTTEN